VILIIGLLQIEKGANLTKYCRITVYEIKDKNKIWANLLLRTNLSL